ncbi:unknown [Sutterella sp. CAG:351]|nr:unknown [Sutterella sp. CAG:351]
MISDERRNQVIRGRLKRDSLTCLQYQIDNEADRIDRAVRDDDVLRLRRNRTVLEEVPANHFPKREVAFGIRIVGIEPGRSRYLGINRPPALFREYIHHGTAAGKRPTGVTPEKGKSVSRFLCGRSNRHFDMGVFRRDSPDLWRTDDRRSLRHPKPGTGSDSNNAFVLQLSVHPLNGVFGYAARRRHLSH